MKSRDTALRLRRFEADDKARKVSDLEHMIRDFETMATDLDRQIQAEEERTGVRDTTHFAYSTFAKSAAQRRDNLKSSAAELMQKLEAAQRERDDAMEQLSRATPSANPRDEQSARRRPDRSSNRSTGAALR
ncbi:MAG: flagellar export protein FliJ [Hyphomicrobium sp.]|nr:MAG: flagellar export protein FliJ [Hyphomicrobium sp.]